MELTPDPPPESLDSREMTVQQAQDTVVGALWLALIYELVNPRPHRRHWWRRS